MKIEFLEKDFIRNKKTSKICVVIDDDYAGLNMIRYVFPSTPNNTHIANKERFEHWKPLFGEYCWFWNIGQLDYEGSPHFGKYGMYSYTEEYYDFLEPFFGNIPTMKKS